MELTKMLVRMPGDGKGNGNKVEIIPPNVLRALHSELLYQQAMHGDDRHSVGEWLLIIEKCLDDAKRAWQSGHNNAWTHTLREIRQVAASGVAAMTQCGAENRRGY